MTEEFLPVRLQPVHYYLMVKTCNFIVDTTDGVCDWIVDHKKRDIRSLKQNCLGL